MQADQHERSSQADRPILLVDDDEALCAMLTEYLTAANFSVTAVHDGEAAVAILRTDHYAAVVLDITMPVLDGFETLRRIRGFSTIPVLMLTARGEELDRIVGLEIGADDYLPKPFNPRELLARLNAVLRRSRAETGNNLEIDDLVLEPGSLSLRIAGQPVVLTATEYGILELLAKSVGTVVSKTSLSEDVLGRRLTPFDRSIDTHIAHLRKKLGTDSNGQPRIKTLRGQGYLLVRH